MPKLQALAGAVDETTIDEMNPQLYDYAIDKIPPENRHGGSRAKAFEGSRYENLQRN